MTKILVVGKNGQVGFELCRSLAPLGEVTSLDQRGLDLSVPDAIRARVREIRPEILVNAAAYTAVDRAESEPEAAMKVNGIAPGILAEEAKRLGALMVHYSTDYVFDGTKDGPYTESDVPKPLSVYGRTKLAGERAIQAAGVPYYIFRTSWVYAARGRNFLLTMLRLAGERPELQIVNDQVGAPTWARFIAEATARVLGDLLRNKGTALEKSGVYNLTATGSTSWFGFAGAIFAAAGRTRQGAKTPKLIPITTRDYPVPAKRPQNSRLDTSKFVKIFGMTPPSWNEMLLTCMSEGTDTPSK